MKKPIFANDEVYHVYNRGVEKRKVFMDKQDHLRFIHNLFEFNNETPVFNFGRNLNDKKTMIEVQPQSLKKPRKLLVEIFIFTLMPNHFHLLLRQKKDNGIVKFMQKLGTGYTMYFNQKYKRVGGLFQGRFKAVLVDEHAYFLHLPHYIHSNPIELANDQGSASFNPFGFLEEYRWSSFPDYIGKKNFPSVTQRDFILNFWGGKKGYKKETKGWLAEKNKNPLNIKEVLLD